MSGSDIPILLSVIQITVSDYAYIILSVAKYNTDDNLSDHCTIALRAYYNYARTWVDGKSNWQWN